MKKIYTILVATFVMSALTITEMWGQYPGSDQVPLDATKIPKFVDFLPHFAGLRVDAKAGGKLIIEAVMTRQVAVSTGTRLNDGTVGPTNPEVGKGNYFVYRISKDGGKTWTLPLWPSFTIEVQRDRKLDVEVRNKLKGLTYKDVNITADQTVMMSGVPLTGNPKTDPYTGPVPIAIHLHGGETPSASDGGPHSWFTPDYKLKGDGWGPRGVDKTLHYLNTQEAATLWYHEHSQLGLTRMNVYAGMAGFYFLRGPDEENDNLAGWSNDDLVQEVTPAGKTADALHPGAYLPEIEIAIQDRMFDKNGELYYPVEPTNPEIHPFWSPEFFGDVITVNGKSWPYLSVAPRKYRFRLLNGSNARFYNMWLQNLTGAMGPAITQVGTDGGLLDSPATIGPGQKLLLGTGERADVIIDFSKLARGTVLTLMNDAKAPYPDGDPVTVETTDRIMQFVVNGKMVDGKDHGKKGEDKSLVPNKLRSKPMVKLTDFAGKEKIKPDLIRQLTLNEVQGDGGPIMVLLNNSRFEDMPGMPAMFGPVTEKPVEGTTEKWQLINLTVDAHPIHMHLVQFQLVSRQNFNADVEGEVPGGYWFDYMAALESNDKIGGGGPPNDYDVKNTDGAVGGNLPVTPYLLGPVMSADPNERGWKDVIRAYPGQIMTYMVRFAPTDLKLNSKPQDLVFKFNPSEGPGYVWHCHIIEHEDNDMMRPINVQPNPSRTLLSPPPVMADNNIALAGFALEQNAPNPFSNSTAITFTIPYDTHVSLKLFNYMGVEVRTLVDANLGAGTQSVILTSANLSKGIYYYQLKAGLFISTKILIIN